MSPWLKKTTYVTHPEAGGDAELCSSPPASTTSPVPTEPGSGSWVSPVIEMWMIFAVDAPGATTPQLAGITAIPARWAAAHQSLGKASL